VSHWRLGEQSGTFAVDQRAINPGSYVNGPQLGRPGLLPADDGDSAVRFDGVDDYVVTSVSSSLSIGSPLTLEAWIDPAALTAPGDVRTIVGKSSSYALRLNGPLLELRLVKLGVPQTLAAPVGAIGAGRPQHVVATYDGSVRRIYVDGVVVAEAALAGGANSSGGTFSIGSSGGLSGFFGGTIDEVAVYGKALATDRIVEHHREGTAGPDSGGGDPQAPVVTPPVVAPPVAKPPVAKPPVADDGPTASDCRAAQVKRKRWIVLVRKARASTMAARRQTVKRSRAKVLSRRRAALTRATKRARRTCAAVR
jgi:hypothetical protein